MEGRRSIESLAVAGGRVPAMGAGAGTRSWGMSFVRGGALALLCAVGTLVLGSSDAHAAACPPIKDKPKAISHVNYQGVQHLTYCYGPVTINPGQNIIRLNALTSPSRWSCGAWTKPTAGSSNAGTARLSHCGSTT